MAFAGKGVNISGKTVKAEDMKRKDPREDWDPREHRLPKGVRSKYKGKVISFY